MSKAITVARRVFIKWNAPEGRDDVSRLVDFRILMVSGTWGRRRWKVISEKGKGETWRRPSEELDHSDIGQIRDGAMLASFRKFAIQFMINGGGGTPEIFRPISRLGNQEASE